MLVGVVEGEGGTCQQCAVPGYRVGGKTGTAQKPSMTHRGYEPGAYVGSFVGFAPAEDPAIVVGVMLDEPRPNYYGGLTAGPTFAKIMEFALNHRRIPPSNPAARVTAEPAQPGAVAPPPPQSTGVAADEPATSDDQAASGLPDWAFEPAKP